MFARSGGDDIAMGTGCTAVSAIITPDKIYVGNSGDSRCIVGVKDGGAIKAVALSEDHKPDNAGEKARIEKAGGFVEENRVKGILNLSRSLGDLEYKQDPNLKPEDQMITCVPEIKTYDMSSEVEFVFLACDGIWDCLTNQQAAEFIHERINKVNDTSYKPSSIVAEMFDKIIATSVAASGGIGCDNMTAVVVKLL
jgi:protein phosphatase PTC2/3